MNIRRMICVTMLAAEMMSAAGNTHVTAQETVLRTRISEWDTTCFRCLEHEQQKMVIWSCNAAKHLLTRLHADVLQGADPFWDAFCNLISFYSDSMSQFLPSEQELFSCVLLPCHGVYKRSMEKYQQYEPLVAALDGVMLSLECIVQKFEGYLPSDFSTVNAENFKAGITKAFRKKSIKTAVQTAIQEHIHYIDLVLLHLDYEYPELIKEAQVEQDQIALYLKEQIANMEHT